MVRIPGGGNRLKHSPVAFRGGFTLAEVLITLGIVGIVAAMTIPNLTTYLKGKRLQSQFKKTYSELNQATRAFYADTDMPFRSYHDDVYNEQWNSTQSLLKFMSYFKGQSKDSNTSHSSFDHLHKLVNLNLNGKSTAKYPCDQSAVIMDIVGRLYTMDDNAKVYNLDIGPKICVDINGVDRPNKWGVDRFVFVFTADSSVVPYTGSSWNRLVQQLTDEVEIAKYCNTTVETPAHTCAYFALKDKSPEGNGNYWYNFLKNK